LVVYRAATVVNHPLVFIRHHRWRSKTQEVEHYNATSPLPNLIFRTKSAAAPVGAHRRYGAGWHGQRKNTELEFFTGLFPPGVVAY